MAKGTANKAPKKYKMKTHSGAKGRFWITGAGKIMRMKIGRNNFRRKKRGQTLRDIAGKLEVSPHQVRRIHVMLPYAKKGL